LCTSIDGLSVYVSTYHREVLHYQKLISWYKPPNRYHNYCDLDVQCCEKKYGSSTLLQYIDSAQHYFAAPSMSCAGSGIVGGETKTRVIVEIVYGINIIWWACQTTVMWCYVMWCYSNDRSLYYRVHFDIHKRKFYRDWSILSPSAVLSFMEKTFLMRLSRAMDRHIREMQKMS